MNYASISWFNGTLHTSVHVVPLYIASFHGQPFRRLTQILLVPGQSLHPLAPSRAANPTQARHTRLSRSRHHTTTSPPTWANLQLRLQPWSKRSTSGDVPIFDRMFAQMFLGSGYWPTFISQHFDSSKQIQTEHLPNKHPSLVLIRPWNESFPARAWPWNLLWFLAWYHQQQPHAAKIDRHHDRIWQVSKIDRIIGHVHLPLIIIVPTSYQGFRTGGPPEPSPTLCCETTSRRWGCHEFWIIP